MIPGLNPSSPAAVARLILTLLFLPVAGLVRTCDLRSYSGTMLAVLTGRPRAYSQRYTERFLARLAHAGAAELLTEVVAKWTRTLWQTEQHSSDHPDTPAVFDVDGHRKAAYSDVLGPRGPVGKLGGKILGCRELVVLHNADGHPPLANTHRGDHHLTIGLPQMLHCYAQATGQALMQRVVVDRDQMAAEFLAQLQLEGRQVITLLRSDQYEAEGSFEQIGEWQADLALQHQCYWEEGWQALPAPPAPTTPKLIPVITTGHWRDAIELAQTYFQQWQCQENSIRDWLIPLNLDTNHGYAKEQVVNSELAKRQLVTTGRRHRLEHLAQACRARLAQLEEQDHRLEEQAQVYEQRRDELIGQVIQLETAGQTEEREYFPVKARRVATDWEIRQREAKLEKNAVRRQGILNKGEGYCRELRHVLGGRRIWRHKRGRCMNSITQRTRS